MKICSRPLPVSRLSAAVRTYRQALQLEPGNQTALFNLGTASYQLDDLRGAAAQFERLSRLAPGDAEGPEQLAADLLSRADPAIAEHFTGS